MRSADVARQADALDSASRETPAVHAGRSRLRASDAFKRTVANELVAAGETHDLVLFLRQYISCLGRVHVFVRQLMQKDVEAWDALQASWIQS